MTRHGVTHARSVELTAQWDKILSIGPRCPVTLSDLHVVEGSGLGDFHRVVGGVHHRLSDSSMRLLFIVGMRLSGGGEIGLGRTPGAPL